MLRRPPNFNSPATLFPDMTLFRSAVRLREAVLSADRARDAVDREGRRGARRQDGSEGGLLYPPVRRRHGALQLRDDQSGGAAGDAGIRWREPGEDRKSTRLNSSH